MNWTQKYESAKSNYGTYLCTDCFIDITSEAIKEYFEDHAYLQNSEAN